jgi:hypothetical protein
VENCDRRSRRQSGLCDLHYQRWRVRGRPTDLSEITGERRQRTRGSDRRINNDGYVVVYAPDHPNAWVTGWILEHRKVMADLLGRPLRRDEIPHHRNGVRTDNRLENLELCVYGHPRGQRAEDLVEWAVALLRQYAPDRLAQP